MKITASLIIVSLMCLITSCTSKLATESTTSTTTVPTTPTPDPTTDSTSDPTPPVDPDLFTNLVLATETYAYSGSTRSYQLIKTQTGTNKPTYMQWIPNDTNTAAGVALMFSMDQRPLLLII